MVNNIVFVIGDIDENAVPVYAERITVGRFLKRKAIRPLKHSF
jgi:hypothetical protein